MFKINLVGKDVNSLVQQHFNGLVENEYYLEGQKIKNGGSLKARIENRINNLTIKGDLQALSFFHDLKDNDYNLLKRIIKGTPNDLSQIIEDFKKNVKSSKYPKINYKNDKSFPEKFGNHIRYVFNYDTFTAKPHPGDLKYDAYELANTLNVNVCPYCNRNYTFTLTNDKERIVRPELDHFFDKSRHPYLALSFYNLIPSCHICNASIKKTSKFTLKDYLHPYLEGLDDYLRFTVKFIDPSNRKAIRASKKKDYLSLFYGSLDEFELALVSRNIEDTENNRKAILTHQKFKTIDLLNKHKDLVVEMLQTAIAYNEEKVQELLTDFEGKLFRNREDVLRFVNRNPIQDSDLPNRAFSKLNRDIAREFGISF